MTDDVQIEYNQRRQIPWEGPIDQFDRRHSDLHELKAINHTFQSMR